jgi:hypothetical protein
MTSTEPLPPGKPRVADYMMWSWVGAIMLVCLLGLVQRADSPAAWVLLAPMIAFGAWLIWRRWRFVRDRIPHI